MPERHGHRHLCGGNGHSLTFQVSNTQALIFDLHGTMVHDMEYHTRAWQRLSNADLGGSFSWVGVKPQMSGKNREVLTRFFGPDRFSGEEMDRLGLEKERRYQQEFRPELALLLGLLAFQGAARPLSRSTSTSCSIT